MALRWREVTADELERVRRLIQMRTAPVRVVERARIIWLAHHGWTAPAIARELRLSKHTVRQWLRRFNAQGLAGLADRPRSGRPPTYTPEEVGGVVALALTDPDALDLPFGCWTLDRLAVYLNEVIGLPIKRSRIGEVLRAEGLRWRTHETWFGARVDPAFAEKRGPSFGCTPSRHPAVPWSASTRWGPSPPRATPAGSRPASGPIPAGR
jgi:transposase